MSTLRTQDDLEVGAATHVGRVRTANEDDYLIVVPQRSEEARERGRVFAVADGMGGVAGGAEASRAALRALGAALAADDPTADPAERLRDAFDAASERVHALAEESPRLADMGTTLTVLILLGPRACIGHVGDTRCLRIRRGDVEQLTEDHAMREPRNLLTRAIGAGQRHEDVDVREFDVRSGDTFVLCTDGVWNVVTAEEVAGELRSGAPQVACERIVGRAWQRGAPDNATIVVVRVVEPEVGDGMRDVDLPAGEVRIDLGAGSIDGRALVASRWPHLLLVVSALLVVLAWLRAVHGFDLFAWIGRLSG